MSFFGRIKGWHFPIWLDRVSSYNNNPIRVSRLQFTDACRISNDILVLALHGKYTTLTITMNHFLPVTVAFEHHLLWEEMHDSTPLLLPEPLVLSACVYSWQNSFVRFPP